MSRVKYSIWFACNVVELQGFTHEVSLAGSRNVIYCLHIDGEWPWFTVYSWSKPLFVPDGFASDVNKLQCLRYFRLTRLSRRTIAVTFWTTLLNYDLRRGNNTDQQKVKTIADSKNKVNRESIRDLLHLLVKNLSGNLQTVKFTVRAVTFTSAQSWQSLLQYIRRSGNLLYTLEAKRVGAFSR